MKTNIKIPGTLYTKLYEMIIKNQMTYIGEGEATQEMEFEIEGFTVCVDATFEEIFVDDSFDHAFGTEYGSHLETGVLEDIEVEYMTCYNEDDEEIDVTDMFDMEKFWDQFRHYGTKSRGIQIHYGDEVVARNYSKIWEKMVYLYTDKLLGKHCCVRKLGGLPLLLDAVLPATSEYLAKIGKSR